MRCSVSPVSLWSRGTRLEHLLGEVLCSGGHLASNEAVDASEVALDELLARLVIALPPPLE